MFYKLQVLSAHGQHGTIVKIHPHPHAPPSPDLPAVQPANLPVVLSSLTKPRDPDG